MILNELLTNTIRHAFVGRRLGHITITLFQQQNHMRLSYENDGVGIANPQNFIDGDSLGMKLIRLLSKQLGGTFEFRQAEGFSLSIEFDHNA
jgi:two-component sensor histidine kinase